MRKPLPKALDIDIDGGLTEEVTPHAGVALLVELGRRSGVLAAAERALPAKRAAKRPQRGSFIPRETDRLAGLQAVVRRTVQAYAAVHRPGPEVTLDVDAHLVESAKETALPTYEGFRGYQPLLVSWAETGLIPAGEVRGGNGPPGHD